MESLGFEVAQYLKLILELVSVAVVGAGFLAVLIAVGRSVVGRRLTDFNTVRLGLARYLALALELQLGADIVGTAISPTWEQIAGLGAIAVIRTGLNFFLSREMEVEARIAADATGNPPSAP